MYFISTIFVGAIFGAIFFFRKDLKKPMLWAGILSVPLFCFKPLMSSFVLEEVGVYWPYLVWTIVSGFFFGGIAAVIFEVLFHKKLKIVPHPHRFHLNWLIAGPVAFTLSKVGLGLSFALSIALGFFAQLLVLLYFRKDLLWDAIISGLFMGLVYLGFHYFFLSSMQGDISSFWFSDLSGILFFNIPIEEAVVVFAFGMLWGPLYEGIKGYEVVNE